MCTISNTTLPEHNIQYHRVTIRLEIGKNVRRNEVFRVILTIAVMKESIKMILSFPDLQIKNDVA